MSLFPHIPIRSCSGCGERAPKSALVRFIAGGSGLLLDPSGRQPGRGAYLHASDACYASFVTRKPPLRSLRRSFDRKQRATLVDELRHPAR